jgi:predicted ArsR family transcriptional regulator
MCIEAIKPKSKMKTMINQINVSPLAKKVYQFMLSNGGSISAREALLDLDITSASLARRITELHRAGYAIEHRQQVNRATGKPYTRYVAA